MELPPLGVCYDEATVRLARWSRGALVASPAVFPVAARFPAGPYRVSEFPDGALVQLDVADPGDGVFLHGPSTVSRCGWTWHTARTAAAATPPLRILQSG